MDNPHVKYSYRLEVEYSNAKADYEYRLANFRHYPNGEVTRSETWHGDKAWAKRHSDHYSIPMPEITKEDK